MEYRHSNNRPARVLLDRKAFAHNLNRARELTPHAKVMAVIKADGYGHGMEFAAESLLAADEFGVSSLDDIRRLRDAEIKQPLNLLSACLNKAEFESLVELDTRPVIYDWQQVEVLQKIQPAKPLPIWLKVDTGMGRLGFSPLELPKALDALRKLSSIASISLMSHLANADTPEHSQNSLQLDGFRRLQNSADYAQCSILNSAGSFAFGEAANDIIRPGLMLYGVSPLANRVAADLQLEPVMTFVSELISVKKMSKGSFIGYGSSYQLDTDATIGIVACGYGDGYPRHAPSGTPVVVNGQKVPLIGRVSMDMIVLDLTQAKAVVGDAVILWGKQNPIEKVASMASTIAYELCCGISNRVERIII